VGYLLQVIGAPMFIAGLFMTMVGVLNLFGEKDIVGIGIGIFGLPIMAIGIKILHDGRKRIATDAARSQARR
jgi:hypothetical protein